MTRVSSYLTATVPALVVLGFFVWFANWIPQTRWDPPAAREITADMTPRQLANVGEVIVRERGCLACHTIEPGAGVKGQGAAPISPTSPSAVPKASPAAQTTFWATSCRRSTSPERISSRATATSCRFPPGRPRSSRVRRSPR